MAVSVPDGVIAQVAAAADQRLEGGRVPHFELVFFLTMEAFGKVHPSPRAYTRWWPMELS